jgi:hypothetical protein
MSKSPYEPKELAKIVYTSKPLYKNSSPYEPRILEKKIVKESE